MSLLRSTRWILIAALLAVMVRSFIPAGYMPDIKSGKQFQMVICSLDGPKTITVDADFDPGTDKADHTKTEHCDFALLQHSPGLNALSDWVVFILPDPVPGDYSVTDSIVAQNNSVQGLAQSRAPPVFS